MNRPPHDFVLRILEYSPSQAGYLLPETLYSLLLEYWNLYCSLAHTLPNGLKIAGTDFYI